MNQNEKSEAQLRNEEAVRRIMAERGYDRSPVKKQKSNKFFAKPLMLSGLMVILLVSIVGITIVAVNGNDENRDHTSFNNSDYPKEKPEDGNDNSEMDAQAQNEVNENSNLSNSNNQSNSSSNNVYESSIEAQSKQDYNDTRTPFDPHHCDTQQAKYDSAMSEVDRLNIVWQNAYNNQTPYTELYKRANKDANLAKKWMAEEQQAVDDAMKALKEAQATANSIYQDEVLPCHKEMYGQQ